jgi:chaperone modulatory protein CbpM
MTAKQTIVTGVILDDSAEFTLREVCRACAMHAEWIETLVQEGVLEPRGTDVVTWRFTGAQLTSARRISRLQRDLGINLAGAALVLELLAEIEALRERLDALDR